MFYRLILFFTQGSRSSVEDKAAAAIFAKKLDDEELSGNAEQVNSQLSFCLLDTIVWGS